MAPALESDLAIELDRSGFVVLAGAIGPGRAAMLRDHLGSALDAQRRGAPPGSGILTDSPLYTAIWPDFFQYNPDLFALLFNDRVVRSLRVLFSGSFVVTRDSIAHWGYYPSWHTDTTTSEARGDLTHLAPDWRMLTIGTYLQHGGGLEVVPGSHRDRDPFVAMRQRPGPGTRPSGADTDVRADGWMPTGGLELPLGPGDVVIFDMRLIHRAATSTPRDDQGRPCEKVAVFSRVSRNIAGHLAAYSDFRFNGAGVTQKNLAPLRAYAQRFGFDLV